MNKKIFSVALATVMAITVASGSLAENEGTGKQYVGKGYVNGKGAGVFAPDQKVTRAEVSKMLAVMKGLVETSESFDDVDDSHWAAGFIGAAQKAKLIEGDELGKFNPEKGLTRAELATIVSRAIGDPSGNEKSFADIKGHWAEKHILKASKAGIVEGKGGGVFDPDGKVTRAEAVKMLNGMDGIRGIDNAVKEKENNRFSDIKGHWAENHIIVASSSDKYVLEDGHVKKASKTDKEIINQPGEYSGDLVIDGIDNYKTYYGPVSGKLVIDGDLTISGTLKSKVVLRNIIVKGDLIINTPGATVTAESSVTVEGLTDIQDVSGNTFNNKGKLASVKISDSNGGSFNNLGTISKELVISPNSAATKPVVLKGSIDVPISVTGNEKPKVVFGSNADIKGKVTIDAKGAEITVDKNAKVEETMEIKKAITLVSPIAVKVEIAPNVEVVAKESSDDEGKKIDASDVLGGQVKPGENVAEKPEVPAPKPETPPVSGGGGSGGSGGSSHIKNSDNTVKKSNTAEAEYTIDNVKNTITGVPVGTVAKLKTDIVVNNAKATLKVTDEDGNEITYEETALANGQKVVVTAENGTVKRYTITLVDAE